MTIKRNLAIVSSGDPEKDRREIEQANVHSDRIDAGICSNGCAPMVWDDPHNAHCEVCGFQYFCSAPREAEGHA